MVGLSFTICGGDAIDVAYDATVLPLFLVTLVALTRRRVIPEVLALMADGGLNRSRRRYTSGAWTTRRALREHALGGGTRRS